MKQIELGLKDHALRAALANEMHVRKLPPITAPARLMQIVLLSEAETVEQERRKIAELCEIDIDAVDRKNFFDGRFGDMRVVWERHTEFSSYMFIQQGPCEPLFAPSAFTLPENWFGDLPGKVVRATQLAVVGSVEPETVAAEFADSDLVLCDVAGGAGRLYSDFRLHEDGFGRLLLVDNGFTGPEAALVVQRLQELGNYRNMALLGLPLAQRLTPRVSTYETELASLSSAVAAETVDDAEILAKLSRLSASLAQLDAETRYRMSASRAYAAICQDRLEALRVDRIKGFPTLADFSDRRLLPAVRTCVSFSARLEDLSQRLEWTSSLLRTRVDTALSIQNRDLLASMDRRTRLQLRLQETVEGLSVFAISYYALGLLGHVLKGVAPLGPHFDHDLVEAIAAPLVVLAAWAGTRRLRRTMRD